MRSLRILHPIYLLSIALYGLFIFLINFNYLFSALIFISVLVIYFFFGLQFKKIFKILVFSFFFSLMMALMTIIYPGHDLKQGPIIYILGIKLYQKVAFFSQEQMIRLFFVSSISVCSSVIIDYNKLLMFLMQKGYLKTILGYPLLIAINSIGQIKAEFDRINIMAKLRRITGLDRVLILIPLLVFAIRHSQRGAMALVTRGLNQEKSYYHNYFPDKNDNIQFLLIVFYFLIFGIIFFIFFNK